DNKGNMLIPILAVEALLQADGALPVNVKFFLEGQEEIGSPQLPAFVAAQRDLLACDLAISSDAGQYSEDQPALLVGLKGLAAVPFDEALYREQLGVDALVGEPGYTPREQLWARPTLEVNGIWGGFQGAGTKTVLPAEAHAKITCRLVPEQDPDRIVQALTAH